ncbi:posphoenolpyruvate synthetase regulatory kinase/phosphorylase PpsR [Rheinheimera baltica]|uniref:posphoenolpyruvate synthetase regulatory kinase/phosphorylase PpsR n=1 Tax=Rheinheimera baltica TaxID=67576 RepID=UPI00273FA965|nr:pyruvate, water dikinase regulatory protein [Rheinheimera baltica]MDP5143417.1 kinase/pyrophosphorylase [Rheinheimera baltica]MDP5151256.1 kinase/pyrophosphorylase [Rheinheimera baltica]MDP5190469.1 kinase/pyrophosphorylase [Rheinheimera baltica]
MRAAFYISDGTAITAEVFGHALLTLFPAQFEHITIPFVETNEMAEQVKQRINDRYKTTGERPLIFQTFVDDNLRQIINSSDGVCYDFLNAFVEPLQRELGVAPVPKTHRTHSIHEQTYDFRIDAVNFALANDDGSNLKNYDQADIILVGVSRSGKTPTSLYLALQYGIKAANYPFVEEDMEQLHLPDVLQRNKTKLFGLTITPERLSQIREQRRANSRYASMRQCQLELNEVEKLYTREQIPFLNSTHLSIEEISAKIIAKTGLKRRKY